jgi:hypothetical protein
MTAGTLERMCARAGSKLSHPTLTGRRKTTESAVARGLSIGLSAGEAWPCEAAGLAIHSRSLMMAGTTARRGLSLRGAR